MSRNPITLSFHDSLLRCSDIDLLRGPNWLNDTIMAFYFEYLGMSKFKDNKMVLFVPPQVTQCIKVTPSADIGVFLDPLHSKEKDFIFFVLNDNQEAECSGGSHWSLLVFSYPEKMIYHFDSSRGANQFQAVELAEKLMKFFDVPSFGYSEPLCLQQTNGYDCGVHVLCTTEHLANFAIKNRQIENCPLVNRKAVLSKRKEVLELIHTLKHNKK